MTAGRFRGAALVVLALTATMLPTAAARADGPRTPIIVARGHSLFGVPWQIRFGEEKGYGPEPDYATFLFAVGDRTEQEECDGCGFYSSVPLPLPRRFSFSGTFGEGFDRFPERDVAGTAGPLVTRLALTMADGSAYEAELLRAPRRFLARHPRLGRFRFFDLFFPDSAEPASLAAYGPRGRLLKKQNL